MKPKPTNPVASILARLRNEAAAQAVPFNQVLQFYAIERFLQRLSKSPHVDGVLLKGALLLKTFGISRARATMDIDLLRLGKADEDSLVNLVGDCASIEDESDGVTFDPKSIRAEAITKDGAYQGTRVRIAGRLDNVRLAVQIDFGVGDVVVPGPRVIEYPALLDQPAVKLRAYPVEAAIAEKFQAMVELDAANSRMKDFYDIWTYARNLPFDGGTLAQAFAATFKRRETAIPTEPPFALTPAFVETHARQWRAFARRIGEAQLADDFAGVINSISDFVLPPARAAARGEKFNKQWRTPIGWAAS